MPYVAAQDLIDAFGATEMGMLAPDGLGGVDQARVAMEAVFASAMIDGYASARYALPLNPVPDVVAGIARDIVRFRLYKDDPSVAVTNNYTTALKLLQDIQSGSLRLEAGGIADTGTPQRVAGRSDRPVFTDQLFDGGPGSFMGSIR